MTDSSKAYVAENEHNHAPYKENIRINKNMNIIKAVCNNIINTKS